MEHVGMFDAKNRFSELVERVRTTGQAVRVTNRGMPVVDITPTQAKSSARMSRDEAFAQVRRMWDEVPAAKPGEIRSLIEEGRK